jgi:hypothetical protein
MLDFGGGINLRLRLKYPNMLDYCQAENLN